MVIDTINGMNDFSSPKYDEHRMVIERLRKKGRNWDFIKYYGKHDEEGLQNKLEQLQEDDMIPEDLNAPIWLGIVRFLHEAEERAQMIEEKIANNRILSRRQDNNLTIPGGPASSWQLYKNKLIGQGWTNDSLKDMENTTISILRKLRVESDNPVKGLTIGHVQSGKTASMAALMAMAADWEFNFFIVLSGTIENLRKQTEDRLMNDLKTSGNLSWERLSKLSLKAGSSHKVSSLLLNKGSRERYLNVCLKNKTRLNDLILWLKDDGNKLSQMRILIIDDESDQGGINTNDVNDSLAERTALNKAIVELVNIQANDGSKPLSMNYVSYTATPYANFLNEASAESLYPRDFVAVLNPAKEYFGAKQIFGLENNEYFRGLPIVREITIDDRDLVDSIHKGEDSYLPDSFEDALHWFLLATSIMRYRKYKKPISMLVHTSQKQIHHQIFAELINDYFRTASKAEIIKKCHLLYEQEKNRFTKEDFEMEFEIYPNKKDVKDYPPFEKIEEELKRLIRQYPSHINVLEDTKRLEYHDGLHLCIDNCANNGINEDLEHVRLAYPDPNAPNYPAPAPAFIVIGGSTLSRGLTIEGLVSTYFLRTTSQADTLLQMGRFFGYRKGYEMLPRIWLTNDTESKFRFMATLEEELREDIETYILEGMGASEYGPKIKNSPKLTWLRITAKNRMQSAEEVDLDFSGTSSQTILFDNDAKIQRHNIEVTENFLNRLGTPNETRNSRGLYWDNVPFQQIMDDFFDKFTFHEQSEFSNIKTFFEWYQRKEAEAGFTNWNVVLAGSGKLDDNNNVKKWEVGGRGVGLIKRTRRGSASGEIINIGVLRAPTDLYADMTKETYELIPREFKLTKDGKAERAQINEQLEEIDQKPPKKSVISELRKAAGIGLTPQLLLYRIDKESKFDRENKENTKEANKRYDLNASEDLIGVSLFVPGYRSGKNLATKLSIRIENPMGESETEEGKE
ncbi:Z1 domain-containing protein [Cytobacillus oceanisediminis]|uniref:Z1 domain-containing protein n=1 Tax=Cytobacillus oceanisediminis TaxID=665099 RepID=UPI001D13AA24|nr:Z1 domain-containing protein [Cytobacillus oceanisediminis]MCC3646866.1 Z1 domain-containing protein [Cytobacillus oceanisediminis]